MKEIIMAYYSSLPNEKQNATHSLLIGLIEKEHNAAYLANVSKEKSKKAKRDCAGRYEGCWFRLKEDWLSDKICNLHVRDCIVAGFVISYIVGINFQSTR